MSEMIDPAVFSHETPATDVPDFDTALRVITALRRMLTHAHKELELREEPSPGEHTIFLDDKHERMLQLLYNQGKLNSLPGEEDYGNAEMETEEYGELDEALTSFVEGYLEYQMDIAREEDSGDSNSGPVLSA